MTKDIERRVAHAAETELPEPQGGRIRLAASSHTPIARMVLAIVRDYPQRAILGLVLMSSQAFFYNAIFFTYALVLTKFYGVPSALDRLVHVAVRARQFLRPAAARAALRPHRAQADDRARPMRSRACCWRSSAISSAKAPSMPRS